MGTPNFNFPIITPNMTADVPRDFNTLATEIDTELAKRYAKPSTGIPMADLSSGVQSAINDGIKSTDKASQSEAVVGTDNTKFMTPLRVNNVTGTLTSLQTTNKSNLVAAINETFTQVVNGKTTIATAINDRGGSASGSDTFQQLADKIEGLVPKHANGTVTSSTSSLTFRYVDATTITRTYITVSGLSFKPSRILVISDNQPIYISEYNEPFANMDRSIRSYAVNTSILNNPSYHFDLDGSSAYVNNVGFRLPVIAGGITYRWYAYE